MGAIVHLNRGGPGRGATRVIALHDDLIEPWLEVQAIAGEAIAFAAGVLALSRQIQVALAAGRPGIAALYADRLERAAPRQTGRAKRAQALATMRQADLEGIACADAIEAPGHGRAA